MLLNPHGLFVKKSLRENIIYSSVSVLKMTNTFMDEKMQIHNLAAVCSFGLEALVAEELRRLGYENLITENGCVLFQGTDFDIANCNINLRCADRLFIRVGSFQAEDFGELFDGTLALPWESIIPENGIMHVVGKSVKSTLHSVPDCQSIVKKAVVKAMQRRYTREIFPEDGPLFKIEVSMLKDTATLSIDTSGAGLHKRGYREESGEAPLRETLAAAIIMLSRWSPNRVFADPMCGSGTIAIEAALYGLNIAPGINRVFASESWPSMDPNVWTQARQKARAAVRNEKLTILASDNDRFVFKKARDNAERAGIAEHIDFQRRPVEEFSSAQKFGCIITNPPYGERMGDKKGISALYAEMGKVFNRLDTWSFFILTAYEGFEKVFGRKSDKNRKLYNGNIKTYLYQYFGPLPPKMQRF